MTPRTWVPRARRLLGRIVPAAGLAVALLGAMTVSAFASAPVAPAQPPARPPVVAILLAPFLTLDDLSADTTPHLWSLAQDGAVGAMNSVTGDPGWPSVTGGALTLSAGRWVAAQPGVPADADSLDGHRKANASSLAVPVLGALGDAVHAAGGMTAAVGSSDGADATGAGIQRPAQLVATDSRGRIDILDTGDGLLSADPGSPLGVHTELERMSEAISSAIDGLMGKPGPRLLVVDSGDLSRAHARTSTSQVSTQDAARDHEIALATLDAAAKDLTRDLPAGSMLLVVTPATDKPYYEPPYLAPVIVSGGGLSGELSSPSTHRRGLVTNLDVAPTVLEAMGVTPPATLVGSPLFASTSALPLAERLAVLARTDTGVGSVDKMRDLYFTPMLVWFAIAVALLATLAAWYSLSKLRFLAEALLLLVLSIPAAAWLMLLAVPLPATVPVAIGTFAITLLVVFAAASAVWWRRRVSLDWAMLFLSALTVVVICADQWLGSPQPTGLFSYSIRAGWRYYGIGNQGSALLVGAALAVVGLAGDLLHGSRHAAWLRRFGIALLGATVVLTAAAPFAGANAGVAIWGVLAFGVTWMLANDVRLTPRSLAAIAAVVVVLVGVFVAMDVLGAPDSQTHLGRFFASVGGGGAWELVVRKITNSINYVPQTPFTWLALTLAALLALLRFAPPKPLAAALEDHPAYRAALLGVVAGAVAAMLTEDSGIVMPALMLLAGGMPALALALPAAPIKKRDRG